MLDYDLHGLLLLQYYQDEKFIKKIGAVEGPEMEFMFESRKVSIETPAAVSGWKIIPSQMLELHAGIGSFGHLVYQF